MENKKKGGNWLTKIYLENIVKTTHVHARCDTDSLYLTNKIRVLYVTDVQKLL